MNYIERARKFNTKKRLGQNFLVSSEIIDFLVFETGISSDDIVLEIGPGIGFVTEKLVKVAQKVVAVELDSDAICVLKKIKADNLEIVHNDILKTDISEYSRKEGKPLKIVANIPYYITSPIIAHLLGEIDELENKNRNSISQIYMMVQYEVAKRLVANHLSKGKDFGLLSVLANFYCDVELVKKVPSNAFCPKPKVDSAIVKFQTRKAPIVEVENINFFKKLLCCAFQTRRKNIKNSLMLAGFEEKTLKTAFEKANIETNERAEKISLSKMAILSDFLSCRLDFPSKNHLKIL